MSTSTHLQGAPSTLESNKKPTKFLPVSLKNGNESHPDLTQAFTHFLGRVITHETASSTQSGASQ